MLKKLSLAALVAMGSMSVASATPLTDAIKGVSLNGFLRIRYYFDNIKNGASDGNNLNYNRWRTNAKLVFGVPVAENMKIVWRVNAQTNVKDKASSTVSTDGTTGLGDSLFYLNYANNGLIANVGVVPLGSLPFASSDPYTTANGPGVVAMYNAGNGFTVAGGWVDHLDNVYGLGYGDTRSYLTLAQKDFGIAQDNTIPNDVYTAGIIYSNDQYGSVQLWDYTATDLIKNAFLATAKLNILKDYGIGVKLAYGTSELEDHIALGNGKAIDNLNYDNHDFWQVELNGKVANVDALVGYAGTNDKDGVIVTSSDATFGAIPVELIKNVANMTDVNVYYGKLAYNVTEKANVWGADAYIDQDTDNGANANNDDSNEFDIGANYTFNKKFSAQVYYANLNYTGNGNNDGLHDTQEVRAQFLYNF